MNNDLLLCNAQSADIQKIACLFDEVTIAQWTLPLGVSPPDAASAWDAVVRRGEVICAWQGRALQGCCAVYRGQVCFAVTAERRMQGLASELLARSLERREGQGRVKLNGVVRRGNEAAQATLLRQGFRFDGLRTYRNKHHLETLASYMRWCG